MSELNSHIGVACLSICGNDVLTLEDLDSQLVVLLFDGRGDHDVLFLRDSADGLGLELHRVVFLPEHRDANFYVADHFAEGHLKVGKSEPLMSYEMVLAIINGAYWELVASNQSLKQFLLPIVHRYEKFLSLCYARVLTIKLKYATSNFVWK